MLLKKVVGIEGQNPAKTKFKKVTNKEYNWLE
jgi:hypothetical protein